MYEIEDKLIEITSNEKREHNWFNNNSKIDSNDLYVYMTTKCKILKERALKRINGICKNDAGDKMIENSKKDARKKISLNNIRKIRDMILMLFMKRSMALIDMK